MGSAVSEEPKVTVGQCFSVMSTLYGLWSPEELQRHTNARGTVAVVNSYSNWPDAGAFLALCPNVLGSQMKDPLTQPLYFYSP